MRRLLIVVPLLPLVASGGVALADSEDHASWSVTAIGQASVISSPEDDDDVGGWFDQYEFTPNKGSGFPLQIGVRDARLDFTLEDQMVFQARLHSPTANFGITGSDADEPFFNQRFDALARFPGVNLDFAYHRIRTEQLRLFPNTLGPGLVFSDRTDAGDRFFRDRTGFSVEGRVRPYDTGLLEAVPGEWLRPELALRGGYEARDGDRQVRFLRAPSNEWIGIRRDSERSVGDVGAGLLVAPGGRFTLAFDFDHERVRYDDPVLREGDLGFPPPEDVRTIAFAPETNRYTGSIRGSGRIGERTFVEAGFVVSELEQVSEYTPRQRAAGLQGNSVRMYGANAVVDVRILDGLSASVVFKYDRRENDIERDTPLFDATQVDPFVESWGRLVLEGELEMEVWPRSRIALGLQYEDVSRDLDFASAGSERVLPANSLIDRDSRNVTLYARANGRPCRGLRVHAELGYRWAQETGYATELDDNLYGELRASYAFAWQRPLVLSGYVRGGTGDNEDFTMVSGTGPNPTGARLPRSYERSDVVVGATASHSPVNRLHLSASFFYGRHDQDTTLDLSTLQRYFQDLGPVDFSRDGKSRFENEQMSLVLGATLRFTDHTSGMFGYSFTRATANYRGSDPTPNLDLVDASHRIDSDVHALDVELRHEITTGLEVLGGYRYQDHDSDVSQPVSTGSAVTPFGGSADQHTITVGASITSEFFER